MASVHCNEYRKHWYEIHQQDIYSDTPYLVVLKGPRFDYLELKCEDVQHGVDLVHEFLRAGLTNKDH